MMKANIAQDGNITARTVAVYGALLRLILLATQANNYVAVRHKK